MNVFHKDDDEIQVMFELLRRLIPVVQTPKYHPEGTVFNHSIQTFMVANREAWGVDALLAALLHDVGKSIISHGHEKEARPLLDGYVSQKTQWLIENHVRIWYLLKGEMKKKSYVMDLINHPWLPELIMLGRWDKMGRNPNIKHTVLNAYLEDYIVQCLNRHCTNYFTENLPGFDEMLQDCRNAPSAGKLKCPLKECKQYD